MADIPITIDVLLAAALAPVLCVILFWFLQLVLIDLQKWMLKKLRRTHEAFCRFTNFIGIFFQTVCHALGYTVTRSGIGSFRISVHSGEVSPKKEKTGVFGWIATSFLLLGPFFLPAGLVLLISYAVVGSGFSFPSAAPYTFVDSLSAVAGSLFNFTAAFTGFLGTIDLFNPLHVGFLLILLFFGLGIRPSYIGEERKATINMIHDLRALKDHLRLKPLYLLVVILVLYVYYILCLFLQLNWYVALWTLLGWVSLTAILALLLTYLLLLLLKSTDHIRPGWKLLPYLMLPVSYTLSRLVLMYIPVEPETSISVLSMLVITAVVTILLIKYKKTNRFKTATKMKHTTVEDGKKRLVKK
ncbi:MAG: hypothetical protein JXA00_03955 [Candidatus Thermoplasmatota archaeon]|nr:hypothetical protein [Candidatus Thermoplasmatota archaeon]